jgi:hypothetical protein
MKDYGAYTGDNPGQVVLSNKLGVLGTFTHPYKGSLDDSGAVKQKDEVAVYLHAEHGARVQVRFSRTELREWCQKVLEMLDAKVGA